EYSVFITEKDYSESTVGRVVQQFFTGSYKELVQHFVAKSKISAEELREVIDLIEKGESR
ncbi:BlaI/MecI/CopY family transcriptional regulator, partial [Planctopirus hydrillae]|uniref:BlaI/MecI/CopY family transcriptional regulator n=1 Tax=Planctopirus hydrillae TaxID=1841610 RepID=UPI0013F4F423